MGILHLRSYMSLSIANLEVHIPEINGRKQMYMFVLMFARDRARYICLEMSITDLHTSLLGEQRLDYITHLLPILTSAANGPGALVPKGTLHSVTQQLPPCPPLIPSVHLSIIPLVGSTCALNDESTFLLA